MKINDVYYKCNYLYPEMFFIMLALNELVKIRIRELVKGKHTYNNALDKFIEAGILQHHGEIKKAQITISDKKKASGLKTVIAEYLAKVRSN